jgi:hypothetical protein
MHKDSHLIFEAYESHLNEMATYAKGKLEIPDEKLKNLPGGGYGLNKSATKTGKSIEQIVSDLTQKIQVTLFKSEPHKIGNEEYDLYYPGNAMKFKNELTDLIQKELGLGKTEAGYTSRIVKNLLNVVIHDEETGGGVAKPEKVEAAVTAATSSSKPTVKIETVYEIDKSVKLSDKILRLIILSLPDEDVPEKEILGILKSAIGEYNDKPGVEPIKIKTFDLLDKLREAGVLKEKQIEKEAAEGEGTGEVETIEDFPEYDDAGTAARELGYIGRGRGYDPGGFSFSD